MKFLNSKSRNNKMSASATAVLGFFVAALLLQFASVNVDVDAVTLQKRRVGLGKMYGPMFSGPSPSQSQQPVPEHDVPITPSQHETERGRMIASQDQLQLQGPQAQQQSAQAWAQQAVQSVSTTGTGGMRKSSSSM